MCIRTFSPCYPTQAGPIVPYTRNPDSAFPGGFHDFPGRLYPGLGRSPGGFPDLDPFRMQAPHQCAGAQGGNTDPPTLGHSITGPSCYDRYRQYHCCSLYQQTGEDPFPHPLRLVVDLFLWLQSQDIAIRARHIPGCLNVIADWLSQPNQPIMTEWSLHPQVVNQIFKLWGGPTS